MRNRLVGCSLRYPCPHSTDALAFVYLRTVNRTPILLFDIMDTVVVDPFYVGFAEHFGLTMQELLEQKHPGAWVEFERGQIGETEFLARFFLDGRPVDRAALHDFYRRSFDWVPGMKRLLEDLKEAGHVVHALSNYPIWYHLIEEVLEVSRLVEWSFVSCETGVRKPDPDAFLGPCRALGVAPGECMLVDDNDVNCRAARSVGLRAWKFAGARPLRIQLAGAGLLGCCDTAIEAASGRVMGPARSKAKGGRP